jgi:hypothetical protein
MSMDRSRRPDPSRDRDAENAILGEVERVRAHPDYDTVEKRAAALQATRQQQEREVDPDKRKRLTLHEVALKRLVVEDLTANLQQRVQDRTLPLYQNRDQHLLAREQADARADNIAPFSITDTRQLRRAADEAADLKWVLLDDGRVRLGSTDTTHAVVADGRDVIAAGELAIAIVNRSLLALSFTNQSGHYQPPRDVIDIAAPFFEAHGIQVPHTSRKDYDS